MGERYELILRHRAAVGESIRDRHRRFTEVLSRFEPPLGYKGHDAPDVEVSETELVSVVPLRVLSKKGRRSYITYPLRSETYLRDNAQYDDIVVLEFDSGSVDARALLDTVVPAYVDAFDCYRAQVLDIDVARADWDRVVALCNTTGKDVDGRDGVFRFHAAQYLDRELCRRAFGLAPEKIVKRLDGNVERASLCRDGAYLICDSSLPGGDACRAIEPKVRPLLRTFLRRFRKPTTA